MRGTDEIRVMVRLPKEDRKSLHTLARLKIRTPSGSEVPLATVANFKAKKSPSFVERNDKVITDCISRCYADLLIGEELTNIREIWKKIAYNPPT